MGRRTWPTWKRSHDNVRNKIIYGLPLITMFVVIRRVIRESPYEWPQTSFTSENYWRITLRVTTNIVINDNPYTILYLNQDIPLIFVIHWAVLAHNWEKFSLMFHFLSTMTSWWIRVNPSTCAAAGNTILRAFINTLRPRQNGRHFADDTFKHTFMNENVRFSIKISLKFVPKGQINNILALV